MTDDERAYLTGKADGSIGPGVGWSEWLAMRSCMQKADGQIGHVLGPGGGSKVMPRWRSHKVVFALKIAAIQLRGRDASAGALLQPNDQGYGGVVVDATWLGRHKPTAPGYYVAYEGDGYASWSPVEAFEAGYQPAEVVDGLLEDLGVALNGPTVVDDARALLLRCRAALGGAIR